MKKFNLIAIFLSCFSLVACCISIYLMSKAICNLKVSSSDKVVYHDAKIIDLENRIIALEDKYNNFDENMKVLLGEAYSRLDALEQITNKDNFSIEDGRIIENINERLRKCEEVLDISPNNSFSASRH